MAYFKWGRPKVEQELSRQFIFTLFFAYSSHIYVISLFDSCFFPLIIEVGPGSVLDKKIDRGARLIFLGLKFLIFLFFLVWKNLSYFFGSEDFSLIFLG